MSRQPSNERGIKTPRKITQQKRTNRVRNNVAIKPYRNRIGKLNCRGGLEESGIRNLVMAKPFIEEKLIGEYSRDLFKDSQKEI